MENEQELIPKEESLSAKKEVKESILVSGVQQEMEKLIPFAGTIEITEDQKKILFAPVKEESIEIRSDGLVYLPWMEYVSRLRDAFGISWAIIPYGMPKPLGGFLYWPFYLMIQGKLAGFAIGEQEYPPPGNLRMTYGDATEGAKSNALMRLCKGIGISLELWKPSFVRGWKEKYGETYTDDKGKTKWRKKNGKQGMEVMEIEENIEETHKKSEKKCAELLDRMVKIQNKYELQNWWKKLEHQTDILSLLPEHRTQLEAFKDKLKEKFAEVK